jgi:iron complex outermembrane receptor protein
MKFKKLLANACLMLAQSAAGTMLIVSAANAAADQEPGVGNAIGEVVVTARKRNESILKVPVVVTAVTAQQLDNLQATEMTDLPKLVPGLIVGANVLSIGTQISLRGVGTSSSDPGVDQSVSLNIDGLSLGQGLAFQSGMFDLQQIEVLKGPQALFYGKSSPGGVISLRTADPTDKFEVTTRAGYDFEARQGRGELIVSGPLTDTLKGRFAGMYTRGDGYFKNTAEPLVSTGAVKPEDREPQPRSYIMRGTLLWNPDSQFRARLKVNAVRDEAIDSELAQMTSCPQGINYAPVGIPFIGGSDNCKLDRDIAIVYMNPDNYPGIPHSGVPYLLNKQHYGTLELGYDITPQLSLTSTTADYRLRSSSLINTTHTTFAAPALAVWNSFARRDFTEEVRLNSDFASPLNFTAGAFYQDGEIFDHVTVQGNKAYPAGPGITLADVIKTDGSTTVDIKTYSVFAQLRWRILQQLELAAGARWTDEKRSEENFNYATQLFTPVATPEIKAKNTSPEVTLTYTPTDDLTLFGAYKRAFKSGSFSIATPTLPGADNSFGDEKVKGGELGVKSRLLDRHLIANFAVYDYEYLGLQVGAIEPTPNGGVPIIRTVNAGSARTYGVDFDVAYNPETISGLSLNGSVNWNHGRYDSLSNVPCYSGQTIALGCTRVLNTATGLFTAQDLSGTRLIRAPDWQATAGFDYQIPLNGELTMVLSNSNQFSSRYVTFLAVGRPNQDNFQKSYVRSDVSVALRGAENRWEVALVGKNVGDKLVTGNCAPSNYSGGLIVNPTTGGATSTGIAEVGCYTDPGRSVWLRVTYSPFAGRD